MCCINKVLLLLLDFPARQLPQAHLQVNQSLVEKKILEWPSQSPDVNQIENLWQDLKKAGAARKPPNITVLEALAHEEWAKIQRGVRNLSPLTENVCLKLQKLKDAPQSTEDGGWIISAHVKNS